MYQVEHGGLYNTSMGRCSINELRVISRWESNILPQSSQVVSVRNCPTIELLEWLLIGLLRLTFCMERTLPDYLAITLAIVYKDTSIESNSKPSMIVKLYIFLILFYSVILSYCMMYKWWFGMWQFFGSSDSFEVIPLHLGPVYEAQSQWREYACMTLCRTCSSVARFSP